MKHPTEHYQDRDGRTTANILAVIAGTLVFLVAIASCGVCGGCVSQTVTIHAGGPGTLTMQAEKPVTVNPQTTGVPGL